MMKLFVKLKVNPPTAGNLFDAEAGQNVRVYRAKNKDDETYKYLHMDYTDGTTLKLTAYENWDAQAHTGT